MLKQYVIFEEKTEECFTDLGVGKDFLKSTKVPFRKKLINLTALKLRTLFNKRYY